MVDSVRDYLKERAIENSMLFQVLQVKNPINSKDENSLDILLSLREESNLEDWPAINRKR